MNNELMNFRTCFDGDEWAQKSVVIVFVESNSIAPRSLSADDIMG